MTHNTLSRKATTFTAAALALTLAVAATGGLYYTPSRVWAWMFAHHSTVLYIAFDAWILVPASLLLVL